MSKATNLMLLLLILFSCKKIVEIEPPVNSITTEQVFHDSADAAAAILGIYSRIQYEDGWVSFCNGLESIYTGLSSDELVNYYSDDLWDNLYFNRLNAESSTDIFWNKPYAYIYQTNACIAGLELTNNLTPSTRDVFIAEAKCLRSLFYFYLVNYFGDIPYVTSSDWRKTAAIQRTSKNEIYGSIIEDLKNAVEVFSTYSILNDQKTRFNKNSASSLLARSYLYTENWQAAEQRATEVIENSQFILEPNLDDVFSVQSHESILQWHLNTSYGNYNCTSEGLFFIPAGPVPPAMYLSDNLLSAFDSVDQRKSHWIREAFVDPLTFYYPVKYKVGQENQQPGGNASEYYTVLRLAELYLIRAESRIKLGNLTGAIDDINVIRRRAGLPDLAQMSEEDALHAVLHERQVEFFAEWGHRWFDLKRTGRIDSIMSVVTPEKNGNSTWQSFQQLYPVPQGQLEVNPFLTQNEGY